MFIKKLLLIILTATTVCSSCTKDKIEGPPGSSGTPSSPGSPGTSNQFNVTFSTIAGKYGDHGNAEDGNGANARFWNPTKMVFDNRNNTLYVADGSVVRSIDQENNVKSYVPLGAIGNSYNEILDIDVAPEREALYI